MTGEGWQAPLYAAAALLSLVQLGARVPEGESYLSSREAHGVHVAMNLGMVAMASSFWTHEVRMIVAAELAVVAALLAAKLAVRHDPKRFAGTVYHLLAVAAMLYGVHLMPAGMAMHIAMMPGWPALILATLFALDAAITLALGLVLPATLLRMEAATSGAARTPSPRAIAMLRLSTVPHIVMEVGMVMMLAFP